MKFSSVLGNGQRLDGGAMFGNAPKALWSRWVQPDGANRIPLACRALLLETGGHKVLFETGIGAYMAPKFRERYGVVSPSHELLASLQRLGLNHADITAIVLSHLHFDHAGGLLTSWREGKAPGLLFPNAAYFVGKGAWQRAIQPHPRDRASFIPELRSLLESSGRLVFVDDGDSLNFGSAAVSFWMSEGHTPGMLLADIRGEGQRVVFGADLVPGQPWVHLPITMGYDRFPERLIEEKRALLTSLVDDGGWLFFTHDAEVATARVRKDAQSERFFAGEVREGLTREALPQGAA